MKKLVLIIAILLSPIVQASEMVTGEQVRDQIIEETSDKERDKHTCKRVHSLGKGTVSGKECLERLQKANKECLEIAKKQLLQVRTENEGTLLVSILMVCPIAKVLDIGFNVINQKVYVQWDEIGKEK